MAGAIDPVDFFYENLGRYIDDDPAKDVATILRQGYPLITEDYVRIQKYFEDVRNGVGKQTISDAARKASQSVHAQEVLNNPSKLSIELTKAEMEAFEKAVADRPKPSGLQGSRLSENMMAVVKQNQPSLLVSTIKPAAKSKIDYRLCGEQPFYRYFEELITNPPDAPFLVIKFDRSVISPDQLSLSLTTDRIHICHAKGRQTLDRPLLQAGIQQLGGIDIRDLVKLRGTLDTLQADPDTAEAAQKTFSATQEKLDDQDVFDVLDLLPRRDTENWNVLINSLRSREAADAGV